MKHKTVFIVNIKPLPLYSLGINHQRNMITFFSVSRVISVNLYVIIPVFCIRRNFRGIIIYIVQNRIFSNYFFTNALKLYSTLLERKNLFSYQNQFTMHYKRSEFILKRYLIGNVHWMEVRGR